MESKVNTRSRRKKMILMKRLYSIVNFKASLSTRRLKVSMHHTMITMEGTIATIGMMNTMRDVITMMKF